ncbi:response regulator [Coralliovum pocilloporae]|uniref:response regulator n=1 Tax=Coralliovum pocilloporae TaxID=3066369 RepID=UPI003D9C3EBD
MECAGIEGAALDNALILIVEDEPDISSILEAYFQREGFRTVCAGDGEMGLQHHQMLKPDLVVLDINLPKADGFTVLGELRQRGDTPVMMVTALAEDLDKLSALRIGADDYVVKPFNPLEVVARAKAILRRGRSTEAAVFRLGDLVVDPTAHTAFVQSDGSKAHLDLTLTEFTLLAHMIRVPSKAFSRAELLDACFPDSDALERTIDSHVSNLRRKLDKGGAEGMLTSVRGIGYRLS